MPQLPNVPKSASNVIPLTSPPPKRAKSPGRVCFVGAGPGDGDLITLRGWRRLQRATVVLYDSLIDPSLLGDLQAKLVYVGKRCGRHSQPQETTTELLLRYALGGAEVVRLKGGDPGVFGRVGEEALALAEHEVPFEFVPGVSSATSAPLFAGIPVTHRGLADSFTVVTAHTKASTTAGVAIPPFSPRRTLVLLMPISTLATWHRELLHLGYPPACPLAFISHGGTPHQRVLRTTVQEAPGDAEEAGLQSPTLVVIGQVVTLGDRLLPRVPASEAAPPEPALPHRGEALQ